jgi:hypothetical protein
VIRWILIILAAGASLEGGLARATEGATSAEDLAAIEAQVRQLELKLADAKALVGPIDAKSPKAPADLPERFRMADLQAALRLAFKQVNPSAQLIDIDCAEYPCVALGTGLGSAQLGALKASPALQPYRQDDLNLFVWEEHVAVIATPKNDPSLGGDGEERVLTRFHRMATARASKGL